MKRKPRGTALTLDYFFERSIPEPNSGCWIWLNALQPNGYGAMRVGNKTQNAHRVAFAVSSGASIPDGMDICHRCDVRCCVNPDHLFVGTRKDNMRDCANKGRIRIPGLLADDCPASKLTSAQVLTIRSDPRSQRAIALAYGVNKGTIAGIKNGLTWRSV